MYLVGERWKTFEMSEAIALWLMTVMSFLTPKNYIYIYIQYSKGGGWGVIMIWIRSTCDDELLTWVELEIRASVSRAQ